MGLGREVACPVDDHAPDTVPGRAAALVVRRGRARKFISVHVLDNGQQPDVRSGQVRRPVRRSELVDPRGGRAMWTGVQWTGTIPAGATRRWFTWGWPNLWHVVWY